MTHRYKDSPPPVEGHITINHQRQLTINTEAELKAAIDRTMRKHMEDHGRPMTEKEKHENLKAYRQEFGPHLKKMAEQRAKRAEQLAKEKQNG